MRITSLHVGVGVPDNVDHTPVSPASHESMSWTDWDAVQRVAAQRGASPSGMCHPSVLEQWTHRRGSSLLLDESPVAGDFGDLRYAGRRLHQQRMRPAAAGWRPRAAALPRDAAVRCAQAAARQLASAVLMPPAPACRCYLAHSEREKEKDWVPVHEDAAGHRVAAAEAQVLHV